MICPSELLTVSPKFASELTQNGDEIEVRLTFHCERLGWPFDFYPYGKTICFSKIGIFLSSHHVSASFWLFDFNMVVVWAYLESWSAQEMDAFEILEGGK